MNTRITSLCVAILLAAQSLPAADTVLSDLRFELGFAPVPNKKEGTVTASTVPSRIGVRSNEHYVDSTALGFVVTTAFGELSPVGIVYGVEYRYHTGTHELKNIVDNGTTTTPTGGIRVYNYSSSGIGANLGFGWALSERWHTELVGILSLDRITSNSPTGISNPNALTSQAGGGTGNTAGVRFGVYRMSESGWTFGLVGEWTRAKGLVENSGVDETVSSEIDASGVSARISIGSRF